MLYIISNSTATQIGVLPSLVQELETLGISIHHLDYLNDNRELDNLVDNLKQEFMNEIREMEEQGLFVNPGGG